MSIDELNKSITISQGNIKLETLFLQKEELSFKQFKGFPIPPELGEVVQTHRALSSPGLAVAAEPRVWWHCPPLTDLRNP